MLVFFADSFFCVIFAPNKWTYDYDNKYCKSDLRRGFQISHGGQPRCQDSSFCPFAEGGGGGGDAQA